MCDRRRWEPDAFQLLFVEHPLTSHLARRLLWGAFAVDAPVGLFRVAEDGTLASLEDLAYRVPAGARVGIVHALDVDDAARRAWGSLLSDYELLPPFPQLVREAFHPTPRRGALRPNELTPFTRRRVKTSRVLGLEARGWRKGTPQDAGWIGEIQRPLPGGEFCAALGFDDGGILAGGLADSPVDLELGALVLQRVGGDDPAPDATFGALDVVVFSELIRDVELLAKAEGASAGAGAERQPHVTSWHAWSTHSKVNGRTSLGSVRADPTAERRHRALTVGRDVADVAGRRRRANLHRAGAAVVDPVGARRFAVGADLAEMRQRPRARARRPAESGARR